MMKLFNIFSRPDPAQRIPAPFVVPVVDSIRVDLQYHRARTGGDFFDATLVDSSCLVFLMMDIAGQRVNAMHLAALAQDEFRDSTPTWFAGSVNESEALSQLCLHLNRTILSATGRAHMTAAFLGVLNPELGTLAYINAGHVPALLLATEPPEFLESTGLPLGLFSHATHEAVFRVIPRGGALLMVSRGVVEARCENGVLECIGRTSEFGADGLAKSACAADRTAQSLCRIVLDSAIVHAGRHIDNDMSVAAISRDV